MSAPQRRILLGCDPSDDPANGLGMQFRLTYAGPLMATQRDAQPPRPVKHVDNKHHIRRTFHQQLRELWSLPPLGGTAAPTVLMATQAPNRPKPLVKVGDLAARHAHYGFNFVPLVTEELDLLCGLEIMFLRPDRPGSVVWAGDIDNRLKTLLDAMRIPEANENYAARTAAPDEQPFYCLLEDDKLITKVSVETDRLLEPINGDAADARLIITVNIRPYDVTLHNIHLS